MSGKKLLSSYTTNCPRRPGLAREECFGGEFSPVDGLVY